MVSCFKKKLNRYEIMSKLKEMEKSTTDNTDIAIVFIMFNAISIDESISTTEELAKKMIDKFSKGKESLSTFFMNCFGVDGSEIGMLTIEDRIQKIIERVENE